MIEGAVGACVQCGACCKAAACQFGEWDAEQHQCWFLETVESDSTAPLYRCGRYEYIQALPASHGANISPAFGGGCCRNLFNEDRDAVIREKFAGVEPLVQVSPLDGFPAP